MKDQVWGFKHEECVSDLVEIDSKMDIFAGMDVGYKDLRLSVLLVMIGMRTNITY